MNCGGKISRSDYELVLEPAVETALNAHEKVRLLYRTGPDFTGFEAGAVFEDMKIGFSHPSRWERIAVLTDIEWIRITVRAFAFLIQGAVGVFPHGSECEAQEWITAL